jgi:hypothetical protein
VNWYTIIFLKKLNGIEIEIGTLATLNEYFLDEYIEGDVHFCFLLVKSLFEAPVQYFPAKADVSGSENSSNDSSADQDMDVNTEQEEDEDLSPDFKKIFFRLKLDCLTHAFYLSVVECHCPKLYIYKKLKEDLEMREIHKVMLRNW